MFIVAPSGRTKLARLSETPSLSRETLIVTGKTA